MELVDKSSGQNGHGNLFIAKNETKDRQYYAMALPQNGEQNHKTLAQEKVNLLQIKVFHK